MIDEQKSKIESDSTKDRARTLKNIGRFAVGASIGLAGAGIAYSGVRYGLGVNLGEAFRDASFAGSASIGGLREVKPNIDDVIWNAVRHPRTKV